jgi:hypothetical protein
VTCAKRSRIRRSSRTARAARSICIKRSSGAFARTVVVVLNDVVVPLLVPNVVV